ncbi:MAG: hypothetical protein ACRDD1_15405, partial [Planctomycetia bacterium]
SYMELHRWAVPAGWLPAVAGPAQSLTVLAVPFYALLALQTALTFGGDRATPLEAGEEKHP